MLTGPPGVGKTSVLTALVDALSDDDVAHAAVEVEALRWAHPTLNEAQEMRHLRALCVAYRGYGHRLLLIAQTIETDHDLAQLLAAIDVEEHLLVRLEAPPATVTQRILQREPESWSGRARLVEHARDLAASMTALNGVGLVLSTDGQQPDAVAQRIRAACPDQLRPRSARPGK